MYVRKSNTKVTGEAGNVVDLSKGILTVQADGSEAFAKTKR